MQHSHRKESIWAAGVYVPQKGEREEGNKGKAVAPPPPTAKQPNSPPSQAGNPGHFLSPNLKFTRNQMPIFSGNESPAQDESNGVSSIDIAQVRAGTGWARPGRAKLLKSHT